MPITVAYLDDLVSAGYGKGRADVMRRFIEDGTIRALETRIISKRKAKDHTGDE